MATVHRVSMTAVVIVCLLVTQWNGTLFASEAGSSSSTAAVSPLLITVESDARAPTSLGLVPAVAIGGQSVETTDVSSASGLQSGRAHLLFDVFAVNAALGTVVPREKIAFEVAPAEFDRFADQIYQGAPYPYRRRHDGSIAAIMIGAAAAIAGAAVLVYANRPECTTNMVAGGCGYGTKVVGTAVLSGGIVGLFVGALTWR
jgi:hypothetical protein